MGGLDPSCSQRPRAGALASDTPVRSGRLGQPQLPHLWRRNSLSRRGLPWGGRAGHTCSSANSRRIHVACAVSALLLLARPPPILQGLGCVCVHGARVGRDAAGCRTRGGRGCGQGLSWDGTREEWALGLFLIRTCLVSAGSVWAWVLGPGGSDE